MNKKTLAGIAFFMGASKLMAASPGVNLQALELLQENRISSEEFEQLMSAQDDSAGTWSNVGITSGTWSNVGVTNDTWSNVGITDGTWSNVGLTASTWSNVGVTGNSPALNAQASDIPAPELAKGIDD